MRLISASALLAGLLLALPACAAQGSKIRVGHFPNFTEMTMLYFVGSYVAGFAKLLGWVTEKVNKRRNTL